MSRLGKNAGAKAVESLQGESTRKKSSVAAKAESTSAVAESAVRYGTRWIVWTIIGIAFLGCAAAVALKGGATEWFGLAVLTGIIVISGILPMLSVIGMSAERSLTSVQIEAGEKAGIELRISRTLRNPFVWIAAADQAKHCNGMEGRSASFRTVGLLYFGREWTVHYRLAGLTRGRYAFESVNILVGDWLGLTSISRTIPCDSELLVLPQLPERGQDSPRIEAGISRHAAVVSGGGPDTRPYREGDSLRHLDFRSAARGRGMHTKIHNVQDDAEMMILIDQQDSSYNGKDQLFDACLGWASYYARISADAGHRVTVAANDWNFLLSRADQKDIGKGEYELRERLAELGALKQDRLLDRAMAAGVVVPRGSTIYVFTGGWQDTQRLMELAGMLESMELQLELYAVTSSSVASFAMREQKKLLEGHGIPVTWLAAIEHGDMQVRFQEGGSIHAISS